MFYLPYVMTNCEALKWQCGNWDLCHFPAQTKSKAQEAKHSCLLCVLCLAKLYTHEQILLKSLIFFTLLCSACKEPQPLDAAVLHLLPTHRQLLRPQYVCRGRGGELPQVPAGPGRGRGSLTGREEAQNDREKAQE